MTIESDFRGHDLGAISFGEAAEVPDELRWMIEEFSRPGFGAGVSQATASDGRVFIFIVARGQVCVMRLTGPALEDFAKNLNKNLKRSRKVTG